MSDEFTKGDVITKNADDMATGKVDTTAIKANSPTVEVDTASGNNNVNANADGSADGSTDDKQ